MPIKILFQVLQFIGKAILYLVSLGLRIAASMASIISDEISKLIRR